MQVILAVFAGIFALVCAQPIVDVGTYRDTLIRDRIFELFGVQGETVGPASARPRFKGQKASFRVNLAKGLQARFVSRSIATSGDQIAFWPDDVDYTHLIVCIESPRSGTTPNGNTGMNPSVQRVNVKTGEVATILHGLISCDPVRTTQWGTVLVGEESGADGGLYEILNPLTTTGHWVASRGAAGAPADIRDAIDSTTKSTTIIKRTALLAQSWEATHSLSNGVLYGGDELRPSNGLKGGAVYKFVPSAPYNCGVANLRPGLQCPNKITTLSQSPLVNGTNYAIQAMCSGGTDFGYGCEVGTAQWVKITNITTPRPQVNSMGVTGYCRPEDMDVDQNFGIFGEQSVGTSAQADADTFFRVFGTTAGLRWCWMNTCAGGNRGGDVICALEGTADIDAYKEVTANGLTYLSSDGSKAARFLLKRFQMGDSRFNGHDNIDFQYKSSNVVLTEDNEDGFGEIWLCLPDGQDIDLMTDGCVSIIGVNDPIAEPTGVIFDASGTRLFFHVQHGSQSSPDLLDFASNPIDGRTDDLLMVTGFSIPTGFSGPGADVGSHMENLLHTRSRDIFGFDTPITRRGTEVARVAGQPASDRQILAAGLTPSFVTRSVATNADQMSFWPNDLDYTHLIVCIEVARSGTTPKGNSGQNPGIQRIELATGNVETIVYGMSRCDGIRTTQWGTILATEENGADGGAYEVLNPLTTTNHWIASRGLAGQPADIRDGVDSLNPSTTIVKRTSVAAVSWEGLQFLHNGVGYYGDELRQTLGATGGALYKFVPKTLYNCGAVVRPGLLCPNKVTSLSQSPLVAGNTYVLQAICDGSNNFGQGCDYGISRWVKITNLASARANVETVRATGFCRPEDLDIDGSFGIYGTGLNSLPDEVSFNASFSKPAGVRFCWTNTCGDGFGEVLCAIESSADLNAQKEVNASGLTFLSTDGSTFYTFQLRRFLSGDPYRTAFDNIGFQPVSNNMFVIEDNPYGNIYACLHDGFDRDFNHDGCVQFLSINSFDAEPTGFIVDGTGTTAYYNIQHGTQTSDLRNFRTNPVDGATDDLIKITGFTMPTGYCGWFAMVTPPRRVNNIGPILDGQVISVSDAFTIKYTPCTRSRIGSVRFYLNGEFYSSDSSAPYLLTQRAFNPPVGTHELTVEVIARGKTTVLETKSVTFTMPSFRVQPTNQPVRQLKSS